LLNYHLGKSLRKATVPKALNIQGCRVGNVGNTNTGLQSGASRYAVCFWQLSPLLLTCFLAHITKNSRESHGLFCLCKQKCAVGKPCRLPIEKQESKRHKIVCFCGPPLVGWVLGFVHFWFRTDRCTPGIREFPSWCFDKHLYLSFRVTCPLSL